jgi:hypothetical protein
MLGYPLVSFFLAAGWGHNERRIRNIGKYIRDHIENNLGLEQVRGVNHGRDPARKYIMNWEHTRLGLWAEILGVVSNYGIFVGSQVFAIAFGAFLAGIDF